MFGGKTTRQAIFGTVKRVGNKALQVLGFSGEMIDDVPLYQQVGFVSHLPKDAEVVMIAVGGKANSFVIVAGQDQVKITIKDGETVVYNQHGVELRLEKDKIVSNKPIHAPKIVATEVSAETVSDTHGSMLEMRKLYNNHVHANAGANPPTPPML